VTLLACSVWAEMVSISQIVSSSAAGPSQATIVLSLILFMAILLLVIMLPVAFFRVKVQDAREQAQFRQVLALLAARACLHRCASTAPYLQVERIVARSSALQQEMTETRPHVLPDEDGSAVMCTTTDRTRSCAATPDESGAAEQATTRPLASKTVGPALAACRFALCGPPWCDLVLHADCAGRDPVDHTTGAYHP
jgi:hypothetical protein